MPDGPRGGDKPVMSCGRTSPQDRALPYAAMRLAFSWPARAANPVSLSSDGRRLIPPNLLCPWSAPYSCRRRVSAGQLRGEELGELGGVQCGALAQVVPGYE